VIFGTFAIAEAAGCILAHAHRLPGRILRKGTVLDAAAIEALGESGTTEVVAARLEPGDIGENEAATLLARACVGPGLTARTAHTGRVNIHAECAGLLQLDRTALDALNSLDEALTVATLPDATPVVSGTMVATVKIIPLAVPGAVLQGVESWLSPMRLAPYRRIMAGLVVTELAGLKESIIEGTIAATAARMEALGGSLLPALRTTHAEAPLAQALRQLRNAGAELLLIAVASATVDRRDVGPAAIEGAGGRILHFGMPVDPGNLICVAEWDGIPVVVLPGCARSPRANGIDLVLRRYAAGLPVGRREIMAMGAGGLLADTEARPLPRTRAIATAPPNAEPSCAAIVLAAGASTRMAPHHKLLIEDRAGRPMIERTVANVLASRARPIIVVTGTRDAEIRAALAGKPVTFVHAADHAEGLSASLRAGIRALPPRTPAALVILGDMPLVPGRVLDRLMAAHGPLESRCIIVPTYKGRAGNPILWDAALFPEILSLTGDQGARRLLVSHAEQVAEVETGEEGILRDFDTVESLATLPPRQRPDWIAPG
jgi:molybdenum cofactor cytidylyltransferase